MPLVKEVTRGADTQGGQKPIVWRAQGLDVKLPSGVSLGVLSACVIRFYSSRLDTED